jgi:hypothetical protein
VLHKWLTRQQATGNQFGSVFQCPPERAVSVRAGIEFQVPNSEDADVADVWIRRIIWLRISMDRISDSDSEDVGSIPTGATLNQLGNWPAFGRAGSRQLPRSSSAHSLASIYVLGSPLLVVLAHKGTRTNHITFIAKGPQNPPTLLHYRLTAEMRYGGKADNPKRHGIENRKLPSTPEP